MIRNIIIFFVENLLIFQIISFFISLLFLSFIIYFIVKINIIGSKIEHYLDILNVKNIPKRRMLKDWKQIQKRLETGETNQLKLAIFEADKILNESLKMACYQGKNLKECLEQINSEQISNIKELRQAHKLKNRLISEPNLIITDNEAEIIIDIYKKTFRELNLIE